MIQFIVDFVLEAFKFYIPVFYTFRFLKDQENEQLERVLKFWTLNSCFYVVGALLELIISKTLYPLIVIAFFAVLNYERYYYSQKIYQMIISPLFEQNKDAIKKYADKIETIMNDETKKLKKGVEQSFQKKAKRVAGTIFLNAMNPNAGKQQEQEQKDQ